MKEFCSHLRSDSSHSLTSYCGGHPNPSKRGGNLSSILDNIINQSETKSSFIIQLYTRFKPFKRIICIMRWSVHALNKTALVVSWIIVWQKMQDCFVYVNCIGERSFAVMAQSISSSRSGVWLLDGSFFVRASWVCAALHSRHGESWRWDDVSNIERRHAWLLFSSLTISNGWTVHSSMSKIPSGRKWWRGNVWYRHRTLHQSIWRADSPHLPQTTSLDFTPIPVGVATSCTTPYHWIGMQCVPRYWPALIALKSPKGEWSGVEWNEAEIGVERWKRWEYTVRDERRIDLKPKCDHRWIHSSLLHRYRIEANLLVRSVWSNRSIKSWKIRWMICWIILVRWDRFRIWLIKVGRMGRWRWGWRRRGGGRRRRRY